MDDIESAAEEYLAGPRSNWLDVLAVVVCLAGVVMWLSWY